ncbi:MAG: copper-translocating P-type ATPase [Clostridium sp.]|nr:copper-translocating P-type ATPase [Clostridium sp.]
MKKVVLSIDGMTCSACSNGLEKYLNKQNGIKSATVNLVMANALIEYDENILNLETLEKFVEEAGFKSLGIYNENSEKKQNKNEKVKFIIFSVLAVALMYISMGHMIGLPNFSFLDMHIHPLIYAGTLLALTIAFVVYGFDIIKSGCKNLIHKAPNMDTLVAMGVITSILYSIYGMYMIAKGHHEYVENLYFESAAIVIFFIKLGRYIDGISKDKTKEAIQKLVQITPKEAVIKVNGEEKKVTIDEIKKGDIVVSKPGERIAVDGEIITGKAHLDESFITGESKPTSKAEGSKVIAGSINYDGYIEYEAEKIGKESTISEIVRLVIEATNTKAPIAKVADTVSGYFVPAVILIAIITFIAYLILENTVATAINVFVTILVVACPCSLGLATPLAIVVSEGVCANNGILVKKSEILENAEKTTTVVFDKTGTLTYGKLKIAQIVNYSKMQEKELMQIVGSLEKKSAHPIGKAFEDYLNENKIETLAVKDFKDVSGYGIIGKIAENEVILGNSKILEKYDITNSHKQDEEKLAKEGNSIIYVVINNEISAIIGVNDIVRENSKEVISKLNKNKIETVMLTGDNTQTAEKIAKEIGITTVISNVTPREKTEVVKKLKVEGKYVMMCGDGINDSPALASSNIGVSVNSGTDIAMDSSDVILTRNDLNSILNLINISKKTIRNIKQNLFWAFFYNSLMIPIAMGSFSKWGITINPMIASLAMVISSLTVTLNALRLKRLAK